MATPTIEERVAHLEGRSEGIEGRFDSLDHGLARLGAQYNALDAKIDRLREELGGRIDALDRKVDRFRDELSARIDGLSGRMNAMDGRIDALGRRFDALAQRLDRKIDRTFQSTTGINLAFWSTILASLYFRA
jgi:chromosome segregation ATPase